MQALLLLSVTTGDPEHPLEGKDTLESRVLVASAETGLELECVSLLE